MNHIDQILMETTYGSAGITKFIAEEIDDEWFDELESAIWDYRQGKYYDSKNERIKQIKVSDSEIATEVAVMLLSNSKTRPIQQFVAGIATKFRNMPELDAIKTAAEIVGACKGIIYEIENIEGTINIIPEYVVSNDTAKLVGNKQYLLPMLVKPLKWETNNNGGWLLHRKSIIHGSMNHHFKKQALDSINILQNIAWELDTEMLEYEEEPNKPLESKEQREQFLELKLSSQHAYGEIVNAGNKFYFPWRFDKRGRMYSQGYHINFQSTSYKKSLLNFSDKQKITGKLEKIQ